MSKIIPECYLAILEKPSPLIPLPYDQDSVLIKLPVCQKCAKNKLSVIRFCNISKEDASDLVNSCQVKCVNIRCEC